MPLLTQPQNPNFLNGAKFRFILSRVPKVMFFGVQTKIPDISLAVADQASPFQIVPLAGHKIAYGDFELTFIVDENFENYLEIYNWMNGLGFPDDFKGYPTVIKKDGEIYSDASLIILTSKHNANMEFKFEDVFPYRLGGLDFDVQVDDVKYTTCTVAFKSRRFYVKSTDSVDINTKL